MAAEVINEPSIVMAQRGEQLDFAFFSAKISVSSGARIAERSCRGRAAMRSAPCMSDRCEDSITIYSDQT